jgi:hypothetical protein
VKASWLGFVPPVDALPLHERCKTWMPGTSPGMTG